MSVRLVVRVRLTFGNVKIEKVTVQDRLNDACDNGNPVDEVLRVVTIDPVENVEKSVDTQREEVVAGDRLGLASLANHEQLRKNGHRFQVDRERPEHLDERIGTGRFAARRTHFEHGVFVIPQESEHGRRQDQKLDAKGVMVAIVRSAEFLVDQVEGKIR